MCTHFPGALGIGQPLPLAEVGDMRMRVLLCRGIVALIDDPLDGLVALHHVFEPLFLNGNGLDVFLGGALVLENLMAGQPDLLNVVFHSLEALERSQEVVELVGIM